MYSNFEESYYHLKHNEPVLSPSEFSKTALIIHIDCSRQREIFINPQNNGKSGFLWYAIVSPW